MDIETSSRQGGPLQDPRITLIIPCWRDVAAAWELARRHANSPLIFEVIIAGVRGQDAFPVEGRIKICQVDRPGRGLQMNLGANAASGDMLLFHHVDSLLTDGHLRALKEIARAPHLVGGAFYRKFDERHPWMLWAEPIERWHSRTFGALYGDQSLFVRREHFLRMGGFAPLPLMEDVEFSLRLRRSGSIALLDPPMSSSPARQLEQGAWRTTIRNLLFLLLFRGGVSPEFLHAWYYRRAPKVASNQGSPSENNRYGAEPLHRLEEDRGT